MTEDFNISFQKIQNTDNIATLLDESELAKVADIVMQTYKNDKISCEEDMDVMRKAMDLALQKVQPREKKPSTVIPLIYMATQSFNADAYPALTRDGNIIKPKIIGRDDAIYRKDEEGKDALDDNGEKIEEMPSGQKLEKGERISEFENYLLAEHVEDWFENLDQLLMSVPVLGNMFKKTYYDAQRKRVVSELIFPLDVIVNKTAKNMRDYPVSHVQNLPKNEVVQRMRGEVYIDVEVNKLEGESVDKESMGEEKEENKAEHDQPIQIIEQHRVLDLDGDGYGEPYIVTIAGASQKILRISKRFKEVTEEDGKIINIEPYQSFVHIPFIPNPEGTFYAIGFGELLYKLNKTVNTSANQLLEAALNANLTRGLVNSNLRIKGQELVLPQNSFKVVSVPPGTRIEDSVYMVQGKEPSPTLYNLLVYLVDTAKSIANITDILDGNLPANMQATTALTAMDRGLKEFKAIYKRIYRALGKEIKNIHEIIKNNPERYSEMYETVVDDPEANFDKDFKEESLDVMLTADTDVVTNTEKIAKAGYLMQFIGNPQLNQYRLLQRILESVRIENVEDLLIEPQPNQPDPMTEAIKAQTQVEMGKLQVQLQESNRKIAEASAKTVESDVKMAEMEAKIENMKADTMTKLASIPENRAKLELEAEKLYEQKQTNQIKQNETTTETREGQRAVS